MLLIDAGMIAFAAFHALKGKVKHPLTRQVPRMLRKLVRETEDMYALFWNDYRLWKRERWPVYRDRPEIWDLAGKDDFETMLEVLTALGAVQYRSEGREADELLAAVCHHLAGKEDVVIYSDDKDFMQLLSGSTRMRGRVRGEVTFSDVKGILGVTPAYVADFLALTGDKVDGIPRIVTPAKAKQLIESRGHVREWIGKDVQVGERLEETLRAQRDQLRLNLELVDLSAAAVGAPPSPLMDGWGVTARARVIGERADVSYLQADDLEQEFAVLKEWGERTKARLA